jgi:hypothetical protein
MLSFSRLKVLLVAAVASVACLAAATSATAAGIVNGDFENGTFEGWLQYNSSTEGGWFTYNAPKAVEEGWPPPAQGNYAAISDEGDPDTAILYQDFTVPLFSTSTLSLTVYYRSYAPIMVPNPNTLVTGIGPFENQQLRVDVMKTTAPIESLAATDILATPFTSITGDPETLLPKTVTADLSAFAGQTVRLRIANAVNDDVFNAGVDSVSLTSTPINTFTHGALKRKNGGATVTVKVPGPGLLKLLSAGKKGKPKPIRAVTKKLKKPGKVKLTLKPTGWGKKQLEATGKLPFKVKLTYKPTGGTATSQTLSGKLKG